MDLTTLTISRSAPEFDGPQVATVTLRRPEIRNAFDSRTVIELRHAFDRLGRDPDLRVIVLTAQGSTFSAGADLHWMREMADFTEAENLADAAALADMLATLYHCPHPVVARVQGDVYGGAMGLVAACDIAVAADHAMFCLSEVRLGLIPATISPYVIRAMGENAARRYFLTAERFSASEAHRIGFIHQIVAAEALDQTVINLTTALGAGGPQAVREAKRLVRDIGGMPINAALIADTAARIAKLRASAQGREGVSAFLDKRKPSWSVSEPPSI